LVKHGTLGIEGIFGLGTVEILILFIFGLITEGINGFVTIGILVELFKITGIAGIIG